MRAARALVLPAAFVIGAASRLVSGICGPFADVSDAAFCPFVVELFTLGITTGTTPTTYDPAATVSRLQMAAFLSRTVDGVLARASARAPMNRRWYPKTPAAFGVVTIGAPTIIQSVAVKFDGLDIWVADAGQGRIFRVRSANGNLLDTWTGAGGASDLLVAMGRIFVAGSGNPGRIYSIDPASPAGAVTTVASNVGVSPSGLAFDGGRFWVANFGTPGSVSIVTPGTTTIPWTTTTVTTGFDRPSGALYDGSHVWITDFQAGTLLRLDPTGAILQTVTIGHGAKHFVFDGSNFWIPHDLDTSVVRASTGSVLATISGEFGSAAAFDGERVLITRFTDSVSLFKAADLTKLGTFTTPPGNPGAACSDGSSFWISMLNGNNLVKF